MGRSMTNQVALLQREVTPGTPLVAAMKRLMGMKLTPGWNFDGGEGFKASGHKVNTAYLTGDRWGMWGVEGIQDFNNLGYPASSVLGPPVSTLPVGGTLSKQHVFTPNAAAADVLATYTAQWGDTTKAIQAAHFLFQSLTLGVQRGSLSMSSGAISREPDETATLATTGVTDVAAVPIPKVGYNVFIDSTWAALKTTKALACYNFEIQNPDKYQTDSPINSAISGFESVVEAPDMDYSVSMSMGFDAAGAALIGDLRAGAIKFISIYVEGPIIETTIKYSLKWDFAIQLTGVGEVTSAPNSSVVTLPFTGTLIKDPVSGFYQRLTLVNTVSSY